MAGVTENEESSRTSPPADNLREALNQAAQLWEQSNSGGFVRTSLDLVMIDAIQEQARLHAVSASDGADVPDGMVSGGGDVPPGTQVSPDESRSTGAPDESHRS